MNKEKVRNAFEQYVKDIDGEKDAIIAILEFEDRFEFSNDYNAGDIYATIDKETGKLECHDTQARLLELYKGIDVFPIEGYTVDEFEQMLKSD